jgi:hypothetical protein
MFPGYLGDIGVPPPFGGVLGVVLTIVLVVWLVGALRIG